VTQATNKHELAGSEPADVGTTGQAGDVKTVRLRELVAQTNRKRELQAQLNDANARITALEPLVAEQFQQDGVQSVNIDGYTIYLNRKLYAGPKDGNKAGLVAALKGLDESWSFLVSEGFNANSLKARVRECELGADNMPIIPIELRDVMAVYEEFEVGARKSK
jgi:hypothetical protein